MISGRKLSKVICNAINKFLHVNKTFANFIWTQQISLAEYFAGRGSVVLSCGIAGIIYPRQVPEEKLQSLDELRKLWSMCSQDKNQYSLLLKEIRKWKYPKQMYFLLNNKKARTSMEKIHEEIISFANKQENLIENNIEKFTSNKNYLLDSAWCIAHENLQNLNHIIKIFPKAKNSYNIFLTALAIISVLRGLDKKLETRGRDSCGLSIMLKMENHDFKTFLSSLKKNDAFSERQKHINLQNGSIDIQSQSSFTSITFTYKVAKVIGQLGDNVATLTKYIQEDIILQNILCHKHIFCSTIVHTRWASQGIVSIENCHPMDNKIKSQGKQGNVYAVLNGDIDNYSKLCNMLSDFEINEKITTDAKIIPLVIEKYLSEGHNLNDSFCKAIKMLEGSFAIQMHSDIEPGKIYLAQQGKGQGLYVGISPHGYHIASEIYGFVEQTAEYIAMKPGQIFILDQNSSGGLNSIKVLDKNGLEITIDATIAKTPITTRDIFLDTNKFQHFLQKEIFEAPEIIQKTLRGKWKCSNGNTHPHLSTKILPEKIRSKYKKNQFRKIYFIGMGTAHAAGEAIAATFKNILQERSDVVFDSLLATEFMATYSKKNRDDTLVIAISQSGGTTDTNTAISKFVEDQASILGIINKRDSDMSFLVDGVLYTGDGRDVEIAVASTKAFYAQVVAGTLYALEFALISGISEKKITLITEELLKIPKKLEELFTQKERIKTSADELAPKHVYWDTLSTGIGKPVSRELKIKLSELCYMSIPAFAAANKKHINLSAEALILCFLGDVDSSGVNHQGSLAKDLRGEIAIFLAQKNTPVVITTQNDITYDNTIPEKQKPYLLLKILPSVSSYFAVITNTAAGHLWSYYAAQALNQRSLFLSQILDDINSKEKELEAKGLEMLQILHNVDFHTMLLTHYKKYSSLVKEKIFTNGTLANDIVLLEKLFLLALNIIPSSATAILFDESWGADKILNELKNQLSYLRTWLSRSIDAIKHQAKYITVGVTGFEGIANMTAGQFQDIFQRLLQENSLIHFKEDVNEYDMVTLTNIQPGIAEITGGLLYNVHIKEQQIWLQTITTSMFGDSKGKNSRYMKKSLLRGGRKAIAIKNNKINIGKGHDNTNTISIPIRSLGEINKMLLCKFSVNEKLAEKEKIDLLGSLQSSQSKACEILVAIQENRDEIIKKNNLHKDISDQDFLAYLLRNISVEDLLLLPHEDISQKIIQVSTKS